MFNRASFQRTQAIIKRRYASSVQHRKIPSLPDSRVETFRSCAFLPAQPFLLASSSLSSLPAVTKWFHGGVTASSLDVDYLSRYGSTIVPLELTSTVADEERFTRYDRPMADFLRFVSQKELHSVHLYLAQCPISCLPKEMQNDVPVPAIVAEAGKGDIYDSSIWIGLAPTYTSLHRDPNPNLFVQLAGTKMVRIFEPHVGAEIFAETQRRIGGNGLASMRGEEMMTGDEKKVLEELVWGMKCLGGPHREIGLEASLAPGDGLFIPRGWWHSIKGVGTGIVGSVNWWFR